MSGSSGAARRAATRSWGGNAVARVSAAYPGLSAPGPAVENVDGVGCWFSGAWGLPGEPLPSMARHYRDRRRSLGKRSAPGLSAPGPAVENVDGVGVGCWFSGAWGLPGEPLPSMARHYRDRRRSLGKRSAPGLSAPGPAVENVDGGGVGCWFSGVSGVPGEPLPSMARHYRGWSRAVRLPCRLCSCSRRCRFRAQPLR